jgi:hypothetical protein
VIEIGEDASIAAIEHAGADIRIDYSAISIVRAGAEPHKAGDFVEPPFSTPNGDFAWRVTTSGFVGCVRFSSVADGIALTAQAEQNGADTQLRLTMGFPAETVFHVPEAFNIVRQLDVEMPPGREYSCRRGLNFIVVETPALAIAVRSEDGSPWERLGQANRSVVRTATGFLFSISVPLGQRVVLSTHSDIISAGKWFTDWMEHGLGIIPWSKRQSSPDWISSTRLFITVDMLRSTGELAHSYEDLEMLCRELAFAGCPKETVFYIPGWNGPYDAAYPDYRPRAELGGESAFGRMMEAVHSHGFRIMIHTNPEGLDPYHHNIDAMLKYAVKDREGRYAGFQTPSATKHGIWGPPFRFLPFASRRQPIRLLGNGNDRTLMTVRIPDSCEACITLGGLGGLAGLISLSHGERTIRSPEGWFEAHNEFTFPFALRLQAGCNQIRFAGPSGLPSGAWYRIHDCRVPTNPYAIWTHPILSGDVDNDKWNALVIGNIAETVERYDIDVVHCDASDFEGARRFFMALRKRLPHTAIGGEYYFTLSGLGFLDFSQSWHNQSLVEYADIVQTDTDFHQFMPDPSALAESLAWLDKPSPLVGLTDGFTRIYPHLCHADAFVPVGKVCTCSDAVVSPFDVTRLRRILDDSVRLGYIPGIRVNYREYGLDEHTKAYVASLGR